MPAVIDSICKDQSINIDSLNEEWRRMATVGVMNEKPVSEQKVIAQCVKNRKVIKVLLNVISAK